ncbi:MAG TPA: hypothetical protein VEC12_11700 [Bacteroidia bacterium]|nr:hypothetical protein [Bacteroidia bacterium]
MKKNLLFPVLLFFSQMIFSQGWDLRLSINYLQCFSNMDMLQWQSAKGRTEIKPYTAYPGSGMYINDYFANKFPEISIIRHLNSRNSLSLSYLDLNGYVGYSIKASGESIVTGYDLVESSGEMPAVKVNYQHAIYNRNEKQKLSLSLAGGILLFFRGRESRHEPLLGTGRIETTMYDFSGNHVETVYIDRYLKEYYRPMPPAPCFNFGVNADMRISKRFKIGLDLNSYISPTSLYGKVYYGETNDTKYTFRVKMKTYFFSSGIYVLYRIK